MSTTFPIELHGKVMQGNKIGRKIDMPTANIVPIERIDNLAKGVYYSEVLVGNIKYKGITNLGTKPTVNNSNAINVETFLYDYDGELYDTDIVVRLLEFRRPEKKFNSIEELSREMHCDLEAGRFYGNDESDNKN